MFKVLGNLVIILLICVTAAGISINFCPAIKADFPAYSGDITDISLVTIDQIDQIENPNYISLKYTANKDVTLTFTEDYMLKATVYKDSKVYKTHYLHKIGNREELNLELTKDTPYSLSIDISQEKLKLPNGHYSITIVPNMSNSEYTVAPLVLNVDYMSDATYIAATNEIPENKMPLTLYFSDVDNSIEQLIGITRFVEKNSKRITTLLNELRKGPSIELGLDMNSPIGECNYISIKNSIAYIDLPSDDSLYTNDSVKSEIAMNSYIKSISQFSEVDKIKFLVDYNKADIFFNGKTITNPINKSTNNKAYLAYNTSSRYFLVDCSIRTLTEESTTAEKVTEIFKTLKEGKYEGLSNTIPSDVNLLDFKLTDNILYLNFSSNFANAYNENVNLQRLMLDSILFSFTSIEDVDFVSISTNMNPITSFAGIDISSPLARPLYINPETE